MIATALGSNTFTPTEKQRAALNKLWARYDRLTRRPGQKTQAVEMRQRIEESVCAFDRGFDSAEEAAA